MTFKRWGLLTSLLALLCMSCNSDSCNDLSDIVVGNWSVSSVNNGDVSIMSDGSLIDVSNVMLSVGTASNEKTWLLEGDQMVFSATDGTHSATAQMTITDYSCDEMTADIGGQHVVTFIRK